MRSFHDFQDDCGDAGLDARQCSEHHWQILDNGRILVNFWPTTGKILAQNAKPRTKARAGKAADAIALAEIIVTGKRETSSPRKPQTFPSVKGHHNGAAVQVNAGEVVAQHPAAAPPAIAKPLATVPTLNLEIHDGNSFTVRFGERYQDHLCWDEMLGCIARVTLNQSQLLTGLKTKEEHAKNPYSSVGNEKRREDSYTALCGLNDRDIATANKHFDGDVAGRLKYLLACLDKENPL